MSASDYTRQITSLIEQQGAARARAAEQSGQIWGGALANLGQIPLQVQQQKQRQQQQQIQQQEVTLRGQEIGLRGQELDQRTKQFAQELADKKQKHDDDAIAQVGSFIHESGNTIESLQSGLAALQKSGQLSDAEIAPILEGAKQDPTRVKLLARGMMSRTPEGRNRLEKITIGKPGDVGIGFEGETRFTVPGGQKTTAELAADAANPKSPTQAQSTTALDLMRPPKAEPAAKSLQSENVLLDGKPAKVNFNPASGVYQLPDGTDVSSRVKPMPPASVVYPKPNPGGLSDKSDVKEFVAGMKDGTLPPQLPGRATKEYAAVMAEAHRQGYDLQAAVSDWNATQKHLASLNGAQQLRLNQAVNQLPELLDTVDELASKWKGGRFPILNKANLAAAKNGVYGADVASIANQLETQIADVTADIAVVYMGGNSPTDHGLQLAAKNLSGNWDEKVLHDMVALARKNAHTRQNSIRNTGVQGASPNNPYAPPPPVVEEWVRDANGKLVKKGAR